MDHNLEDTLNLETSISEMDFENPENTVVNQPDSINVLDTNRNDGDISMEFEQIEEKSTILMDTGNEEIIVSDFMEEQFALQEYSISDNQTSDATTTEESNMQNILHTQSETMVDLQFEPQTLQPVNIRQDMQTQPKFIAVKVATPNSTTTSKKVDPLALSAPVSRHVPIAPKPPKLVPMTVQKSIYPSGKQYAIAPKPVALIANKSHVGKKVPLNNIVQTAGKGNSVLAQVGKQYIMVPSSGGAQKIKLVPSSTSTVQYVRRDGDQAQLNSTKNASGSQSVKSIMAKVVVQGSSSQQPAVITKIMPSTVSSIPTQARYVMQQKTIPISIGNNKVLITSPNKPGKKQPIITIKSAPSATSSQTQQVTTKKVLITANPSQKVILKSATPTKTAQVNKEGKVMMQGQRSQLHKIDVPGKGVQFIRLISNPNSVAPTSTPKQTPTQTGQSKTFVLSDSKGNLIQMTAEKLLNGQPPGLVVTGNTTAASKSVLPKPQQKLVRIAPAPATTTKTSHLIPQARSGQSLLTPIQPMESAVKVEPVADMPTPRITSITTVGEAAENTKTVEVEEQQAEAELDAVSESKSALQALIADTVADEGLHDVHEVEIEYDRQPSPIHDENTSTLDQHDSSTRSDEHPLIVIPSNYMKQMLDADSSTSMDQKIYNNSIHNADVQVANSYQPPLTPPPTSEPDLVSTELGMRPRKACNCTKSQCLKLYCDCFANGEFCNQCNCNNCHNNLVNEELRQRAIRACLDRNPNAFRPKIGKSKAGGPEIIRRHNKGCNCKRSGCLKNYCECYEAKIACTSMCKCVGCRNVEETLGRARRRDALLPRAPPRTHRPAPPHFKQPCSFMTTEVIEAVCQCLVAAAAEGGADGAEGEGRKEAKGEQEGEPDPIRDVIEEFARCLQDIISASHQTTPLLLDEAPA